MAPTKCQKRVDSGDWDAITAEVNDFGGALLPRLLTKAEVETIRGLYPDDHLFRAVDGVGLDPRVNVDAVPVGTVPTTSSDQDISVHGSRLQRLPCIAKDANFHGIVCCHTIHEIVRHLNILSASGVGTKQIVMDCWISQSRSLPGITRVSSAGRYSAAPADRYGQVSHTEASKAGLASSVARRARDFYRLAHQTLPVVDRRSMVAAELMGSVYWRLLRKLERRQFEVFGPKLTRLHKGQKILLIFRTWCRFITGAISPNYGTP